MVYSREPIRYHGNIPVFSESNEYTQTYEEMSKPRLEYLAKHGDLEPERQESEYSTVKLIRKYGKPGQAILDVGIGLARQLSHFPEMERYGIDISYGYLEEAEKKGINVCYALVEEIPYKQELFDMVVCTDVLEHLFDLNFGVSKLLSVLKSNGYLICRTPYREDLRPYLAPDFPYRFSHLRTFDEHSLCLLFEKIFGCEVVENTFAVYLPLPARFKCKLSIPKRDQTLNRIMAALRKKLPGLYKQALQSWYDPVEINTVVLKK